MNERLALISRRSRVFWWAAHLAALVGVASFAYGIYRYGDRASAAKVILFLVLSLCWFVLTPLGRFLTDPDRTSRRMSFTRWEVQWFLHGSVLPCLFAAVYVWMAVTPWKAARFEKPVSELLSLLFGG